MKFLAPLFFAAVLPAAADFHTEHTDTSLKVFDGETLITEYRTNSRVPYLDPLLSPGGACLTRHWPMREDAPTEEKDHPHHRAFWLSHGDVNGFDFWAWKGAGDPKIEHRGFSDSKAGGNSASFTVDLAWTAGGQTHLLEKRTYSFTKSDSDSLEIQVASLLTAAEVDVTFGDTKEGFIALRMDRSLRLKGPEAKGHIVNSEGLADMACWGKRANWVAFTGPDETGQPAVVALMDHPSNLRHPTWWHARDYGLLAANPFGIHDFEGKPDKTLGNQILKKGDSLTFRYLVVLHHGSVDSAKLADHWSTFSK